MIGRYVRVPMEPDAAGNPQYWAGRVLAVHHIPEAADDWQLLVESRSGALFSLSAFDVTMFPLCPERQQARNAYFRGDDNAFVDESGNGSAGKGE